MFSPSASSPGAWCDPSSESSFTGVYVSSVVDYPGLLADLAAEEADLDAAVAGIGDAGWATRDAGRGLGRARLDRAPRGERGAGRDRARPTPRPSTGGSRACSPTLPGTEAAMLREGRARSGPEVLAWWRAERERVLDGLRARDPADRIPWITGRMSAVSFATARLMETWAHGQDVVDALGVDAPADGAASPRGGPRRSHAPVQLRGERARVTRRRRTRRAREPRRLRRGRGASRRLTWYAATRSTSASWSRSADVPTTRALDVTGPAPRVDRDRAGLRRPTVEVAAVTGPRLAPCERVHGARRSARRAGAPSRAGVSPSSRNRRARSRGTRSTAARSPGSHG